MIITYDHGVESGRCEAAIGAREAFGILKVSLEIRLLLDTAAGKCRRVVEALLCGERGGANGSQGQSGGGGMHRAR